MLDKKKPARLVEQNSTSSIPRAEQEDVPNSDEATPLDALVARIQEVVDNLVAERYPQSNAVPTNITSKNGPVSRRPNGNKDSLPNQHNDNTTSARNSLPFPTSDDIAAIWLKRFLLFLNNRSTRCTAAQHELLDDERTVSMIKQLLANRKADGQKQYQFNICNETWETNSPLQIMKSILNGISPMTRSNTSHNNQEELLRLYDETATSKESLLQLIEGIKTNISFERQLLSNDLSAKELHVALNMTSALVTRSLNIWAVQYGSVTSLSTLALPTETQSVTNYGAFNTFCEYIFAAVNSVELHLQEQQKERITELSSHHNLQTSCRNYINQDHHKFNSTSCTRDTSPRESKPTLHHILGVADLARIVESFFSGSHNGTPLWSVCRQLSKGICTSMDQYLQNLALRFSFGRKTEKAEESLCRLLNKTTNANRVEIGCYIGRAKGSSFTVTCQRPIILDRNNSKVLLFYDWNDTYLRETQMAILSRLVSSRSTTMNSIKFRSIPFTELNMNELRNCASLHTLDLSNCENLCNVNGLGNCASLHTLNLSNCENLCNVNGLGNCASLHTLNLSHCENLNDVSGLGNCASLHTLNLSNCENISDVSGLGECASLHTLNLSNCENLSNVSVLGNCASLHTLNFSGCYTVRNVSGLGNCASLHTLNLSNCENLIDVSGLENCASLHTLGIYGTKVNDMRTLANIKSLQRITLPNGRTVKSSEIDPYSGYLND